MSAIGGIWWFGEPGEAERAALGRLHAALARRGPEGGAVRLLGPLGMSFRAFPTCSGARRERQPLTAGGRTIVWDGRLDNRDDLLAALSPAAGCATTDASLVLLAHERWQERCPDHLVGDYAFAVWDAGRGELLLARDPMGARPLFYHASGDLLAWSSTLTALLDATALPRDLDEEWIAGFLTDCYPRGRTPYRALRALPPGYSLLARVGGLALREHWRPGDGCGPEPTGDPARATDAELEERFLALLRAAVGCRLRAEGPVGAELSGGLDSSSIVCLAAEQLAQGQVEAADLLTLSYVFEESPTADERRYIRAVEAHIGRSGHHIPQERFRMFASLAEPSAEYPCVLHCTQARDRQAIRIVRGAGGRVLLSGLGGDDLLWSEMVPIELSDDLRAGRFREVARGLRQWSGLLRRPVPLLLAEALRPLAGPPRRPPVPAWVAPSFARRCRLPWRVPPGASPPSRSLPPSRREHCAGVASAIDVAAWSYDRGPERIEIRWPFLDRRLVDFCLSLPVAQFLRGAETRSLHRRALRGVLPAVVAARRSKAALSEGMLRDFAVHWPEVREIFPRPLCCQLGFVDEPALLTAMTQARAGLETVTANLLRAVSLEFWLRSRAAAPAPARPEPLPAAAPELG